MNDFKSGLNPFSSENLSTLIITLIIMGVIYVLFILFDKYVTPRLTPDNRFVKWWKKHIIDEDPDHL